MERGGGVETEGQGGWGWREVFGAVWSVLSWVWWGVAGLLNALQVVVVVVTLQTNWTVRKFAFYVCKFGVCVRFVFFPCL